MITEIGIVAGEIWHYLDQHGEVSLSQLVSGIDKTRDNVLMSLGWLARRDLLFWIRADRSTRYPLEKMDNKKGVVLFVVLATILLVIILSV